VNLLETIKDKNILLFDGSCGLCNDSIKFVLKREKNSELYFSPLQSEFGKKILKEFDLNDGTDSMVFIQNGKPYIKSSAALRLTKFLKAGWPLMAGFLIVPGFIRNAVYDLIARNRITWFGSADYCEMMTPELRKRFIEQV
jgi:predicted DCC family thiol-disulfide oxidoreductase YuxK